MLSQNRRVAGNARQKSAVIKENAKYSFVELGKFNTMVPVLDTGSIFKQFGGVRGSNPRGGGVSDLYNYRKGCNQSRRGNLDKKWI